jgi:hypothetical protein
MRSVSWKKDCLGAQQRALRRGAKRFVYPHECHARAIPKLPTLVCLDRASVHSRRRLPRSRDLARTAIEVAEILAHLVEREPQSENAFQGVHRHTLCQPLLPTDAIASA